MNNTRILIAEDDKNLGILLSEFLQTKGFNVQLVTDGEKALNVFKKQIFNFCIFDVMMPKMDGFTLAKEIREMNQAVPIIFLTAKSMREDRIEGLTIGADDYLTKPFSMQELLLRIQAIQKRVSLSSTALNKEEYQIGKFTFKPNKRVLQISDQTIKLTSKESQLLHLLVVEKNNVVDRTVALKKIWQDDTYYNSRSMDVYVTKLRKYLKEDVNIELINVHGKGFKLIDE